VIPESFLRAVLGVETVLALACVVVVALHALWLWRRDTADGPRRAQGHAALAAALAGEARARTDRLADLRRLPTRVQAAVVDQLAVSVTGEEGRRVAQVASSLGLVAKAQRRCRSRWWWRRLLGAHQLNTYGGGDDVLEALFDDPHPAVRAQAIEWAGDARRADLAPKLAAALADPSALCRHTAADSILRAGASLVDALHRELASTHGRQLADLLTVLARRPDPRYGPPALAAAGDDMPAVRVAAAEVLGGVGGEEAGRVLRALLTDGEETVRAAAADGLRRVDLEDAVPDLAPLLRDPAFAVRRAAGAALAALGPGGTLLLRHYSTDSDPSAADMARYSLDVAALRRNEATFD
jgi:hypothetical protein